MIHENFAGQVIVNLTAWASRKGLMGRARDILCDGDKLHLDHRACKHTT